MEKSGSFSLQFVFLVLVPMFSIAELCRNRGRRGEKKERECSPSKGEKLGKLLVSQPQQKLGFSVKTC